MGYIDEDGFVFVGSRIKRLIIRPDGFKVFPSMIENAISHHPAVRQCSVVGCVAKDHPQGRLPFVFVVLDPAAADKKRQILRELRQLCVEELPEYVQPVAYKFISEMPLTPVARWITASWRSRSAPGLLKFAYYGRALCTAVFGLSNAFKQNGP